MFDLGQLYWCLLLPYNSNFCLNQILLLFHHLYNSLIIYNRYRLYLYKFHLLKLFRLLYSIRLKMRHMIVQLVQSMLTYLRLLRLHLVLQILLVFQLLNYLTLSFYYTNRYFLGSNRFYFHQSFHFRLIYNRYKFVLYTDYKLMVLCRPNHHNSQMVYYHLL